MVVVGSKSDRDAHLARHLAPHLAASPERVLQRRLEAGVRGLLWITADEARAVTLAEDVGETLGWPVHTWSAATGVDGDDRPHPLPTVLAELRRRPDDEAALWVVLDGTAALSDPSARRTLRELAQRDGGPALLLVEPEPPPWATSIPELSVDVLPPPTEAMLVAQLDEVARVLADSAYPDAVDRLVPHASRIARAALGLPLWAFDRLLAEAVLAHGTRPQAIADHIGAAKPALLDRSGLLEVVDPVPSAELGGLADYKAWLSRRALSLSPGAAEAGIGTPRGVLLLGVQGCGKSLAARVSASLLGLPLVRLEPGRLFGGTVGASEANLRRVTALVERLAPIVLWLDEIDKGLAGAHGSTDSGTTARVIGSLLTWLAERSQPVFVAATANRVDALPPELLRRGRLDEIFFVDLPDAEQRAEILRVHLQTVPQRTLGRVPPIDGSADGLLAHARAADGFSGAELEAALTEARLSAYAERRPLSAADLQQAIASTVPLSRTRAESIDALRRWAEGRARRA